MAVNENVYGNSNQWIDSFCEPYITNKDKIAYFGENMSRLENGVAQNKLSYDEGIDKSLSYCGLGTECALSHIGCFYHDGGVFKLVDWDDRFVTNFAFMQQNDINIHMSNYYTYFDLNNDELQKRCFWQSTRATNNLSPKLQPYTKINPKNFVLLIKVDAYNSDFSSVKRVTLADYMANWKDTYPCINVVYFEAYFNRQEHTEMTPLRSKSGTQYDLNSNQLTLQYCQLDAYNVSGKNMTFYSYYLGQQPIMGSYIRSGQILWGSNRDLRFIAATENCKEHCKIYTTSNSKVFTYIEYFDGILDEILKTFACFGLYFTDTESVATSGRLTDNNMYIGLLDENGIGHGLYLRGADTANAPQNNYTNMSQSGYDYTKDVDKTKYKNDTEFYTTWTSSAFTKMYVLRGTDVSSLANELYTAVAAAPTGDEIERYNQSVFLTQNPIDCIISLKKFPIEFFATTWQPVTSIKLGSYTCNTNGAPLPYTTGVYNFTFSNSTENGLYPWFDKSFLDYEPYTKCELTIPFCGTVEIPTTYLHDYDTIDVKLIVDFITGACTAYIQARDITIDSVSGECAISLPVNGIQSATLDSQIHSAATARNKSALTNGLGLIGGLAAVGIGIATGGIGTAVIGGIAALTSGANMITQDKNIEYELQHMQMPLKQVSAASGAISQSYDMRCKMRITRPKISPDYDATVYADTVGFACLINTTVDSLSGLTVGTVNLDGINATEQEKEMINQAFARGVIL